MGLKDLFTPKVETTSLRGVLGNDAVKAVVEDFIAHRLSKAEGIIIIWAQNKDFYLDHAGLSLAEVIGGMHLMGHQVEHDGLPR